MELYYANNRIYAQDENDKVLAEITFPDIDDSTVDINHTFADPSFRGQGIADRLVRAAAESLDRTHKQAVVSCPYAQHWFEKHPEFRHILK